MRGVASTKDDAGSDGVHDWIDFARDCGIKVLGDAAMTSIEAMRTNIT